MLRTDDPVADYDRYDAQVQSELDRLPKCSECGNPIQDEECYEFNDELICEGCLIDNHRKWVEDYVQ
jgi:formylmethanofuran dehydrogenase subunit E